MRTLRDIAYDIQADWKSPYFGAVPYLSAMLSLESIEQRYGGDSGRSVVSYFLANASSYRGDKARQYKAELKSMLKNS